MPIAIAGISDSWAFGSSIAQQLDSFTQQGHKLPGLMIKVARTVVAGRTTYQVEVAGGAPPAVSSAPASLPGALTPPVVSTAQPVVYSDGESIKQADELAKFIQRLLYRQDFLKLLASEFQAMKDEGLWG